MPTGDIIVTFFTTHAALRAEKVVKEAGVAAELIPAPRALSADCTIALRFPQVEEHRVRAVFEVQGIETSEFHEPTSAG